MTHKFTGYERDAESGNDYAMARYHISRLGRFNGPDPIAGSPADPQSLNRYAYVRNDPTNLIDPLGLAFPCPLLNSGDPDIGFRGCDPWGNFSFIPQPDFVREFEAAHTARVMAVFLEQSIRYFGLTEQQAREFLRLFGMTLDPRGTSFAIVEMSPSERLLNDPAVGLFEARRLSTIQSGIPTVGPLFPRRSLAPGQRTLSFPPALSRLIFGGMFP